MLQRRLVNQGVSAFTDRNGRDWGLESYARMAVKTTSAEAVFHGTQSTLIAKGLDIVEVNRVRKPCLLCKPYDGGTFSLTGRAPWGADPRRDLPDTPELPALHRGWTTAVRRAKGGESMKFTRAQATVVYLSP